jgi:hypothetical protein
MGGHTFNIYGVNDPREMSRQIADFMGSISPIFSPASK